MFKSTNSVVWLGREKEKKALKLAKKHLDKVIETVESMKEAVEFFCDVEEKDKIENASKNVLKKERQADSIKAEIMNELSKGIFHPLNQSKIISLVTTADDIADNARGAGAKITLVNPSEMGSDLRRSLKDFAGLSLEMMNILEKAYSTLIENPELAIAETEKVEKMEEKIDHFRARNLIPKLVEWADQAQKTGTSIVLLQIEDNIEEVADQAENTGDIIREIALSSK